MIQNYLRSSFRSLKRNWNFSVINILGLTLGLASCIVIFFAVRYELSFDTHHQHYNDVYRFVNENKKTAGKGLNVGVPLPVIDALRNDFPELKDKISCTYGIRNVLLTVTKGDEKAKFSDPSYAVAFLGPEYFNLLDYHWVVGSPKTSLTSPGSAVLSESQAKKLFGNADPMGKIFKVNNHMDFTVTGIIADAPSTTSFPFNTMLSFSSLKNYGAFTNWDDWVSTYGGGQLYMRLPENISEATMNKRLKTFAKKYRSETDFAENDWKLQPVSDIHFSTISNNYANRSISKGMIWSMISVAGFILISACVNFINLATAQSLRRSKEVGVRKVLGSSRGQLLKQYLSETGFLAILAILFALLLAQISMPYIATTLNINADGISFFGDAQVGLFAIALFLLITVLAGFYPALIVSGFQPIQALKGKITKSGNGQGNLRRGLIVLQFTISQLVLIGTVVVYSQMKYFRTLDIGFEKEQIVNLPLPDNQNGQVDNLKAKLADIAGIKSMSFSAFTPMSGSNWQTGFKYENEEEFLDFEVVMRPADSAYIKTYGLELVAGRTYLPADTMREYVVNEAFVKKLGLKTPQDAIGKRLSIGGSDYKLPIVGVVKNFNTYSLHREIIPCVLTTSRDNYGTVGLKINGQMSEKMKASVEKAWAEVFPDYLFKYTYLDETISAFYEKEERLFSLFRILTGIAIFIGCLGLYGVVAYMVESRTKEMGIRKAIGATGFNIFSLFSVDFLKLVVVALILASPIAWYTMSEWLQGYNYHITLNVSIFLFSGVAAIVIALLTVSVQSLRAARMNPVKALRTE